MNQRTIQWNEDRSGFSSDAQSFAVLVREEIEDRILLLYTDGQNLQGGFVLEDQLIPELTGPEKARLMQKMMKEIEESTLLEDSLFNIR